MVRKRHGADGRGQLLGFFSYYNLPVSCCGTDLGKADVFDFVPVGDKYAVKVNGRYLKNTKKGWVLCDNENEKTYVLLYTYNTNHDHTDELVQVTSKTRKIDFNRGHLIKNVSGEKAGHFMKINDEKEVAWTDKGASKIEEGFWFEEP